MQDRPLFIHSGIGKSVKAAQAGGTQIEGDVKAGLIGFFAGFVGDDPDRLIFPAFNYDYGRTRIFNVDSDPVQVGSLPEYVRASGQYRRSEIPFFSISSAKDLALDTAGEINPFGVKSGFQWLLDQDATLMFAGAALSSITFIHFVEEISGKPVYRYEKSFPGQVVKDGEARGCDLRMHVRPMGVHMDYDWPRLEHDLLAAGIMKHAAYSRDIMWMNTRKLTEFWGNKIADNPLYLLDGLALDHFKGATNHGRRRVSREEYENV